jgi:tetratricopeptide (TPR) repeat protein
VPAAERVHIARGRNTDARLMPAVPEPDVVAYGVRSTIGDMTRYIRFQLEEKDPAVRLTHQAVWGDPNTFALGMNWFMGKTPDGNRRVNNDGTTFGFTTYVLLYPALRFGVILMTNTYDQRSNDRLGEAAEKIFETAYYTPAQRASDGFRFSAAINILLDKLKTKGFDQAIAVADDLKTSDPAFTLHENEVNAWAYFLLGKGKKEEALAIFQLNVHLYPESANPYDSLGEIYALLGNKELAIKNYERSLELDPGNTNAVEQLKQLRK